MKTNTLALALLGLLPTLSLTQAKAQSSYQLVGCDLNNGFLYNLDLTTGLATQQRGGGPFALTGIAFDPLSRSLYGLTPWGGVISNSLVRIDPSSGNFALVGSTGIPWVFEGDLAFSPITGRLFGMQSVPNIFEGNNIRNLFRMSTNSGHGAVVGSMASGGDFSALAFDDAGTLYTIDSGGTIGNTENSVLYTVNPATGALLTSVELNVNLGATVGMTFDPSTGMAYVADGVGDINGGTGMLYRLDVLTGFATSIGLTGIPDGISGLAFVLVPEPSIMALLAPGIGLAFVLGRRRASR